MNTLGHHGRDDASNFSVFVWQEDLETQAYHVKVYAVDFVQVLKTTWNNNHQYFNA